MLSTASIPILYGHASSQIGGGNKVLLRIIAGLDRQRFNPFSVIPEPGPIEQELRQLEIPYAIVNLRAATQSKWTQGWSTLQLQMACRRKRLRPQLVHANELPYRTAANANAGAKCVCHVHHPGSTTSGLEWLFRRVPDLVITPSRFVKDEVETCLAESRLAVRVEAVMNPIDLDWFRPAADRAALRRRLGLDVASHHVTILGALTPHKGHVAFLQMARRVLAAHPKTTFHIVGGDMGRHAEYAASLVQLADELQIAEHVRHWGFVADEVARDVLAASDLFVLPTSEEGFGLVLAEAQACQVPVLTSDIRPLDEVVPHGEAGYLLPLGDVDAFAAKACELLADNARRAALGEAGRRWVEGRFGCDAHVRRVTELYEELIRSKKLSGSA